MKLDRSRKAFAVLLAAVLFAGCSEAPVLGPEDGQLSPRYSATASAHVVAGFDYSRGGAYSIPEGWAFTQARSLLVEHFGSVNFRALQTLAPEALDGADLVVLSAVGYNNTAITPLTAQEQSELRRYVESGGCLMLLTDNSTFSPTAPAANESLVDAFGFDTGGALAGRYMASVKDPVGHPITSGPAGVISEFPQNYPGAITGLSAHGTALADNDLGVALATIEPGALARGSGRVTIFSDANSFTNYYGFIDETAPLLRNAVAACNTSAVLNVAIDIKPGSEQNTLNLGGSGRIPAAILTNADFDAASVDAATVSLGDGHGADTPVSRRGNGAPMAALEDVDSDSDLDLVLHFDMNGLTETGDLNSATEELVLLGRLVDGRRIRGVDAVRVIR